MGQSSHVTPLFPHSAVGVVLLEESGLGPVKAWHSPRWLYRSVYPLGRCRFDVTRSLLDVEDSHRSRFPEYRVLEVLAERSNKNVVLYAPFSLDTFMLAHHNWTSLDVAENNRQRWEALADLARHIEITEISSNNEQPQYNATIGDLRAINPETFRFLPLETRTLIEEELRSL